MTDTFTRRSQRGPGAPEEVAFPTLVTPSPVSAALYAVPSSIMPAEEEWPRRSPTWPRTCPSACGAAGESLLAIVAPVAIALDVGGHVVVLGSGVDQAYARSHGGLLAEVLKRGTILSEQPSGAHPRARRSCSATASWPVS